MADTMHATLEMYSQQRILKRRQILAVLATWVQKAKPKHVGEIYSMPQCRPFTHQCIVIFNQNTKMVENCQVHQTGVELTH